MTGENADEDILLLEASAMTLWSMNSERGCHDGLLSVNCRDLRNKERTRHNVHVTKNQVEARAIVPRVYKEKPQAGVGDRREQRTRLFRQPLQVTVRF